MTSTHSNDSHHPRLPWSPLLRTSALSAHSRCPPRRPWHGRRVSEKVGRERGKKEEISSRRRTRISKRIMASLVDHSLPSACAAALWSYRLAPLPPRSTTTDPLPPDSGSGGCVLRELRFFPPFSESRKRVGVRTWRTPPMRPPCAPGLHRGIFGSCDSWAGASPLPCWCLVSVSGGSSADRNGSEKKLSGTNGGGEHPNGVRAAGSPALLASPGPLESRTAHGGAVRHAGDVPRVHPGRDVLWPKYRGIFKSKSSER